MLCCAMLCYAVLCYAMLCCAMLYYAMLCYAYTVLYYAVLCNIPLSLYIYTQRKVSPYNASPCPLPYYYHYHSSYHSYYHYHYHSSYHSSYHYYYSSYHSPPRYRSLLRLSAFLSAAALLLGALVLVFDSFEARLLVCVCGGGVWGVCGVCGRGMLWGVYNVSQQYISTYIFIWCGCVVCCAVYCVVHVVWCVVA
jgi:hypothetical protein